jgi:uncharacterized membrane protein YoaK (UPF0700 family)
MGAEVCPRQRREVWPHRTLTAVKTVSSEFSAGVPLSVALSFIGGYTDAITFMITGLFAGHLSGNAVLFPISVITKNWSHAGLAALAVTTMVFGIGASTLFDLSWIRRNHISPLTLGLAAEVILFCIAGVPSALHHPLPDGASLLLLCLAMGLQTGALRRVKGVTVYTAFMAGMVTRLSEGETDRIEGRKDSPADNNVPVLAQVFGGFMAGAFSGAAMAEYEHSLAYLCGALMLAACAIVHSLQAARAVRPAQGNRPFAASRGSLRPE